MRKATLLLAVLVAACSGRQAEPAGPAPTPRPETVAEATGADNLPEVILPDSQLTDEDRAAIRIERLEIGVDPAVIREGETAVLSLGAYDEAGERVEGASGQLFVVGQAAEITDTGDTVVGRSPGEARITVLVEVPASASGPARTLREEALLEVLPARVTSLELVLPAASLYAGARYLASSTARSDTGVRSDADVRWSSSDESVVRIGAGGTMVAGSPGTARIEVTSEGITTGADVSVVANPIRQLRLDPLEASLRAGDVVHFSARALDAGGMEVPDAPIEWSVAPVGGTGQVAATIDGHGAFVADEPGLFRITATIASLSEVAEVAATPRPARRDMTLKAHGTVPSEAGATTDLWVFEGTDGRDYAYTGTMDAATMYAWDVTDPTNPVITDSVKVDGRRQNDVKINADATLAIITSEGASNRRNGFTILDISDAAHPTIITHFTDGLTGGVHNVWIEGNIVYAVHNGTNAVHIVDISDPANPLNVGRWQVDNPARSLHDIMVLDGLAYLSYWDDGLVVLDVGAGIKDGTPIEPQFVSQYKYRTQHGAESYGNTHHAIRYKNYVFLGDEIFGCSECVNGPRGHVHVVDVTDIENPSEVATYWVPEAGVHNLWAENDKLYVAYYQGGLRVVDISGELRGDLYRQGREIGWYMTEDAEGHNPNNTDAWGPQPYKGNIFVSDFSSGLWVVKLEEPRRELIP
ncbi:MAG: Ig-like domain-containing protein [Gemmatimonadetes bacterium]|nr:Ig-like domain-containing protein [Gemmatimonadota bacterium]MBT8479104.1 Ig-like domain-containing protein [Gemmatimonadota bacterium]